MLRVKRALLSVSDKTGLVELARGLTDLGVEIVSTGGTSRALDRAGIRVTPVSEVTGFPEILDGRVKTLHPLVHGGILADRGRASHAAELADHGIAPIDLVVVNLYPFREAAASGAPSAEVVEMIDIGGPTLVRAAAKNHQSVLVVVDPEDYPQILAALDRSDGEVPEGLRRRLAAKAFRHTQSYDAAIASWLQASSTDGESRFPQHLLLDLERAFEPRYGENPHQPAAVYRTAGGEGLLGGFVQHQGKELSFNNLLDADAARRLAGSFEEPAVAIVKHGNPCGVGRGAELARAYERALACDPMSAFGSVVATNRPVDEALARAMASLFVEVVVAPGFAPDALAIHAKKKSLRLLECPLPAPGALELRAIDGGFLGQQPDDEPDRLSEWTCVTRRAPSDDEERALTLAWTVVRAVRSNAIVIANAEQTVGIGAGQMSRVDSCRIAVDKAELELAGTAAASDAFFPFADGLETLAAAGVSAVVQPGGSKRDEEVIAAADAADVAMLFTGRRHFRH